MRLIAAIVITALLVACSDPKNTPLPREIDKMESIKPVMEKLSEEERKLVAGYLMRHTVGTALGGIFGQKKADPMPDGMTIGKAIEEQRAFLANMKAEEEKQKAREAAAKAEAEKSMAALREAVSATFVKRSIETERGYSGMEINKHLVVTFAFTNHTDKPVAAVKGTIDVEDLFGDNVTGFHFSNSETIAPGKTITWTGSRSVKYGLSSDRDTKFAGLDEGKFKTVWKPEGIVFSDGTKLGK